MSIDDTYTRLVPILLDHMHCYKMYYDMVIGTIGSVLMGHH